MTLLPLSHLHYCSQSYLNSSLSFKLGLSRSDCFHSRMTCSLCRFPLEFSQPLIIEYLMRVGRGSHSRLWFYPQLQNEFQSAPHTYLKILFYLLICLLALSQQGPSLSCDIGIQIQSLLSSKRCSWCLSQVGDLQPHCPQLYLGQSGVFQTYLISHVFVEGWLVRLYRSQLGNRPKGCKSLLSQI